MMVKFDDLVSNLEKELKQKKELGQQQVIDKEIKAWITIYKQGANSYKKVAIKWLEQFFVNANFVNKKSDIFHSKGDN